MIHPKIPNPLEQVAFTGSTAIGRTIMKAAADSNLKKVTLELGGKSPNIVFNDADIEQAISWVNFGIYFNHGQCCCAGTRIFVQEGIYDKFLEAFKKRSLQNKVGDPFESDTFQGPQVSQLQYDRIMGYIETGKKEGATVETGGERHGDKGYFIKPTIFSNVTPDMKIMQEEIFGPVCAIAKFKDEAEAIKLGNDTSYGLAAGIHTKDLNTSIRVANGLKAGTVWVNSCRLLCYAVVDLYTDRGYRQLVDAPGFVRWLQVLRHRARARRGGARQLHRAQDCPHAVGRPPVLRDWESWDVSCGKKRDMTLCSKNEASLLLIPKTLSSVQVAIWSCACRKANFQKDASNSSWPPR